MTYPESGIGGHHSVNEGAVELAAMSWLDITGWRVLPGDYLAPDGPMGSRDDYRQTILEGELRSALAILNPDADSRTISAAITAIQSAPSQDLLENNRAFHPWLISGVPVEVNKDGENQTVAIRLIDRVNLDNNRFIAANQFVVQGDRETVRPDVVLFVNGLPLCVLELKNPTDENATLEKAYTQLQNYKDKVPELFRFNAALVISDGMEARIGSLTAGIDRFAPWRTIDGDLKDDIGHAEPAFGQRPGFIDDQRVDFF